MNVSFDRVSLIDATELTPVERIELLMELREAALWKMYEIVGDLLEEISLEKSGG